MLLLIKVYLVGSHTKLNVRDDIIWDPYGSVMWRYMITNMIINMKMKIYKPLHSYPTLPYWRWVLLKWVTHVKVQVTNLYSSTGHQADRARGCDGPDHNSLSDRIGGTLELVWNPPRRTLQNHTKGRWHSGSCGESKSLYCIVFLFWFHKIQYMSVKTFGCRTSHVITTIKKE